MKVNIIKSKQILAFHLLKFKAYEQFIKKNRINFFERKNLIDIIINFKKSLKIILNYHNRNKMIIFIGLPSNLRLKINRSTCHFAISDHSNFQNVISISKSTEGINLFPKFNKKPNLIVLVDHKNADSIILHSERLKIPLIYLNSNLDKRDLVYQNIYKVSINNKSSLIKSFYNLFFISVQFLLLKNKL